MSEIESVFNLQLVRDYDKTGENLRLRFDRAGVPALQDSLNEKLEAAERLYRMGVPFNEINAKLELGFDEIIGGDVGYINSGLIPTNFDYEAEQDPVTAASEAYGANP
jgi:hypothetical protein